MTTTFEFDPYAPSVIADPFPAYRVLREEHPVYRSERRDFWALSRAADVYEAMRDWPTFSSSKGMDLDETGSMFGPGNFLNMDPPAHDQLRKVVRGSFSARRIGALEPMVRARVAELFDGFAGRETVDLAAELAAPLPLWMISELLGVPHADREQMGARIHAVLHREAGDPEIPPSAHRAHAELRPYFAALAAERRRDPREDALTEMVTARLDDAPLSDEVILALCLTLFAAGSETVSNFVSNSLLVLAEHPDERAALFAEPAGIPTAIEELLRYESPVQNLVRTTMEPVVLHGVELPADSRMLLLLGSANRDERRVEGPDRLDLTREPRRHLAFGEGVHFCLGAPLARLQSRVVLEEIARRAPRYAVAGPVARVAKVNSRGLESLPVALGGG
ncbi:MAG TPA: cytochrome P450 [Conexibacter sp.]